MGEGKRSILQQHTAEHAQIFSKNGISILFTTWIESIKKLCMIVKRLRE